MSDKYFLGDNPISGVEHDLFNFEHYAIKVQKLIQLNAKNHNPFTIGIYGKWGEGKTSFLRLVENKIDLWAKEKDSDKGILKYHFNPWIYGTKEEMLFDFFEGLSNLMYTKKVSSLKKVGKGILRVSKYLKALKLSASIGLTDVNKLSATVDVGEIFNALGEDLSGDELSIESLKEKVNIALKEANYKVVVFIDDLDRLDKEELYTMLKLIKLNGSFDNFVYLVALDLQQVAKAIKNRYGENDIDGEAFLEKIINIPVHLPRIEDYDFKIFFEKKLEDVYEKLNFINEREKLDEFKDIRNAFHSSDFNSPREVIRLLNCFFIGAFAIGEEVNLYDLFWVEYLKIKFPKVHKIVKTYSKRNNILIKENELLDFNDGEVVNGENVNGTRKILKENYHEAYWLIEKLFPFKEGKMFPCIQKCWKN